MEKRFQIGRGTGFADFRCCAIINQEFIRLLAQIASHRAFVPGTPILLFGKNCRLITESVPPQKVPPSPIAIDGQLGPVFPSL